MGEPEMPWFYSRRIENSRAHTLKFGSSEKSRTPWNKRNGARVRAYEQGDLGLLFSYEELLLSVEAPMRKRSIHSKCRPVAYHSSLAVHMAPAFRSRRSTVYRALYDTEHRCA
jgi:hypothetical protein